MLCEKCRYFWERKYEYGAVERRCIVPGTGFVNIFHDVSECTRFEPKLAEEVSQEEKITESGSSEQNKEVSKGDKEADST